MALSLKETQAIADLATLLYSFLPGEPHPLADQALSFKGISAKLGLGPLWSGGSKRPAIIQLLSLTLEKRRELFCKLIVEIVRGAMIYRHGNAGPVTREEIERLNELVANIGFKIPELYDPNFLKGLAHTANRPPAQTETALSTEQLQNLQTRLLNTTKMPAGKRGFEFERFLGELFELYKLAPRASFRLIGEQIDGSFQFHGSTYLVEAKWQGDRIGQAELLTFFGKVSGKAQWTRGLFISISGFTEDGLEAFSRGKPTNIICMDGLDLHHVLQGRLNLLTVLERKSRRAAETNEAFVAVRELFPGVI
jgi:hypothetical protein